MTEVLGNALLASYLLGLDQMNQMKGSMQSISFDEPVAKAGPIELRFDVPPEEAIDYFRRKRVVMRKQFDDLRGEARSAAFTVGGIYRKNVLQSFHEEIAQALENGTPQREVVKGFREILEGAGHRELGAFHLETIARTNLQMAYGVGRRRGLEDVSNDLPFWEYHAVLDDRTRPTHAALDGIILPANHEFWSDHFPPWGFNCRCSVTATAKMPGDYDRSNPSGEAQLSYDRAGVPVKAEYGTAVYDLSAGRFTGVQPQAGLQETIEQAAERAQRERRIVPQQVRDTERAIRFEQDEHLHFFDSEGNAVANFKGTSHEIKFKLTKAQESRLRGGFDVHNHADNESFSLDDILDAASLEIAETRIISPRYSYVMRPPASGWSEGLVNEIKRLYNEVRVKVVSELQREMWDGTLPAREAPFEEDHRIWKEISRELGLRYQRKKIR